MNTNQSSKTIHYDGLYREESSHLYDYIFSEDIQTRSKDFQWEIASHFHSRLYQFFLAEKGTAKFRTDDLTFELEAPFFVFIPPNCDHGFQFSELIQGNLFTFSSFYTESLRSLSAYADLMSSKEIQWASRLLTKSFEELLNISQRAHNEIFSENEYKTEALQLTIASLFLTISRIKHSDQARNTNDRGLEYFKRFTDRIQHFQDPSIPLQQYADDLNISTGHLNRICRIVKGKSALQVIHEFVIRRAKVFLHHTTYSVNEVAYQLGIEDPSYFIRLFKKQTGLTPGQFRAQKFSKH